MILYKGSVTHTRNPLFFSLICHSKLGIYCAHRLSLALSEKNSSCHAASRPLHPSHPTSRPIHASKETARRPSIPTRHPANLSVSSFKEEETITYPCRCSSIHLASSSQPATSGYPKTAANLIWIPQFGFLSAQQIPKVNLLAS